MAARPTSRTDIPPLENGDRLSLEEFERRYHAMPERVRAELVEGVVYLASPTRTDVHGEPHFQVSKWMGIYCDAHPEVRGSSDATVRLDGDNGYQPDVSLRYVDGQSRLSDDGYLEGAPELVFEVSASSTSYEMHAKKNAYRRSGVKEYVVWRVLEQELDWFILRGGEYELLTADDAGVLRSEVFPGLRLDVKALLDGDYALISREQFAENERHSS